MHRDSSRWKAAVVAAAHSTLAARWQRLTNDLGVARSQYLALLQAELTDISALRKATQRLHDLQQERNVLSCQLQA